MPRRKMVTKTWADYDIGDPSQADQQELSVAVRRAAKAANQRLLRLERAGHTKGIYENAMYDLVNRRRFQERTGKLSLNALRHEYKILRSFFIRKNVNRSRVDKILLTSDTKPRKNMVFPDHWKISSLPSQSISRATRKAYILRTSSTRRSRAAKLIS